GWIGEHHFSSVPVALYGVILLMASLAYAILQRRIIALQGPDSLLRAAVGADFKGKLSPALYALAVVLAWWSPEVSEGLYVLVALLWFIPDRRIARTLEQK